VPGDIVPTWELCGNGRDDDGDGLVDCEDGGCADTEICVELDCADGADSDNDGLVDCQDEDCWAGLACHPAGVRARVHMGTMTQRLESKVRRVYHGMGGSNYSRTLAQSAQLSPSYSRRGKVTHPA